MDQGKHFLLERLHREIKNLEEQEQKLELQLSEVRALRQKKQKELNDQADDRFTSEMLAKVREQRRSRK